MIQEGRKEKNMLIKHTKNFGVYYWDTFDNETFLEAEFDTVEAAMVMIFKRFNIKLDGADQVDIVNKMGDVIDSFRVG